MDEKPLLRPTGNSSPPHQQESRLEAGSNISFSVVRACTALELGPAAGPPFHDRIHPGLCVPKTYATWADVLHLAVGSCRVLVLGQVGGAELAEGATILGLWA
jgi:hypothetical protein